MYQSCLQVKRSTVLYILKDGKQGDPLCMKQKVSRDFHSCVLVESHTTMVVHFLLPKLNILHG